MCLACTACNRLQLHLRLVQLMVYALYRPKISKGIIKQSEIPDKITEFKILHYSVAVENEAKNFSTNKKKW